MNKYASELRADELGINMLAHDHSPDLDLDLNLRSRSFFKKN
jgi:hypothetical protein